MRGWTLVHRSSLRPPKERLDSVHEARFLFDQALKSDPSNAEALAGSARVYGIEYAIGQRDPGTDYDAKVLEPTNRAIVLDPNNIRAYYTKSEYLVLSHRASEALSAADAGLAVNPNDAVLLLARANAENALGRYEQAKADMESAIRLSPRDPIIAYFHVIVGTRRSASVISTPRSTNFAKRSTLACMRFRSTCPLRLLTRLPARWMRRRPPLRKPAASNQSLRSSG
jgi:adenylate cyclase